MGRGSGACRFLLIIFTFSLLVQGSWAVEVGNGTNTSLNSPIDSTINNSTIDSAIGKAEIFPGILLFPLFFGCFLFLSWLCRFFDRMNLCFITFVLAVLLLAPLRLYEAGLISKTVFHVFIGLILFCLLIVIVYEYERRKKSASESNLIMGIHDILRNFIVIFMVLIWPIVLLYFDYKKISYITFYGIDNLQFPVYIIAASFVGVLSYFFLSIQEKFGQLIPEYKKISIAWSHLKRILTAPFIAIVGFYLLNHLLRIQEISEINDYFVFVFAFFAGVFTKTIEKWIFAWVQKLLPGDKKDEFDARVEYSVENSCFVTKLRLDEDLAYLLYSAKIRTIEELATFDDNNMGILINKVNIDTRNQGEVTGCLLKEMKNNETKNTLGSYTREQLQLYVDRAKYYTKIDETDLVKYLKMDRDLAFKLWLLADIKDRYDLKNCDPKYIHKKICDHKTESQEVHDRLCECSEEIIQNYKEKAKVELEQDIPPVAFFLADPISGKAPLDVQFTDKSTGSPNSWRWDFGEKSTSAEKNTLHTYSYAGQYTVSLTVENEKGNSTNKKEIRVR